MGGWLLHIAIANCQRIVSSFSSKFNTESTDLIWLDRLDPLSRCHASRITDFEKRSLSFSLFLSLSLSLSLSVSYFFMCYVLLMGPWLGGCVWFGAARSAQWGLFPDQSADKIPARPDLCKFLLFLPLLAFLPLPLRLFYFSSSFSLHSGSVSPWRYLQWRPPSAQIFSNQKPEIWNRFHFSAPMNR